MEGLGKPMEEAKLKAMISSVDEDGGGEIDLDEFLLIMAHDKANTDPLDEARKIFALFDKDGGGTIDANELGDALRAMGNSVSSVLCCLGDRQSVCVLDAKDVSVV